MDFDPKFISFYLYFLISLVSLKAEECIKVTSCSCATSKHKIDLRPLSTGTNPRFTYTDSAQGYIYEYQPCGTIVNDCNGNAAVCQKSKSDQFNAGLLSTAKFSGDPVLSNLQLMFTGPDQVQNVVRTSTIRLICTTADTSTFKFIREDPSQPGSFFFELTTKYACPNAPSPGPSPGQHNGLSTGSILLILFFVFLAVYFIGGILFLKFMRGAQGTEMVPNYGFWTELHGLIKGYIVAAAALINGFINGSMDPLHPFLVSSCYPT